jgi:formate hydrogenlyase transcriptional activator
VGSSRTRKVDVRVITATNRDLRRAVSEGKFREDLYYRLSVFPLTLPALRERGNDVLLLAEAFARQFAGRTGLRLAPLGPEAAARLREYPWPGNVRELQNVIEQAVLVSEGPILRLPDSGPFPDEGELMAPPGHRSLEEVERQHIIDVLESAGWKLEGADGAAALLGLKPSTLRSRMQKLEIRRPRSAS